MTIATLTQIIAAALGEDPSQIIPDIPLHTHGADDCDAVEITIAIEIEADIELPEGFEDQLLDKTPDQILELLTPSQPDRATPSR